MKLLDFFIHSGIFKSKGEAIRAIKNKITLKINDIDINESHLDGDIIIEDEKIFITNFDVKKMINLK